MHGREGGENWKRCQHMWSVPSRGSTGTRTVAGDSFFKDGRKISVGDSALFKPPQDSPPFIGIIRSLTSDREHKIKLVVNWLYRPIEVKLGKAILLDAAPNEVFYSFHKDEIPAASLLHPCKVAFLPKGVELPSGISSFVCRRVYDIANKCLWWLTDQDYIDERQEEVDQLLNKTQIDMHATLQPGSRSPKPLNSPTSTSQLKPGSDNLQSSTSFASQAKGKKREWTDQCFEIVKRERSSKADDEDSGQFKLENVLKSEISKITEKGGLVDSGGVEKLVQLMQPDRAAGKMDLIGRTMLVGVIAGTEKFDCLGQFVELKGLPVLDEWLQDVHKGKIGNGSPKDVGKSVEEFLLVLLRALDKLPVNLNALQMCNIGKSVNHLRSHKNLEIQKKARVLVDTWKKRVQYEMNVIDAKSGSTQAVSWSSRSHLPEVSHGGSRHPGGSLEVAMKSSGTQLSASKSASVKPVQGEFTFKSNSSSPGPTKSALSPASGKDGQSKIAVGSTSDIPSTAAREEKSSSSSQSHNNSQSCSSDHAKTTVFSGKEDARSSSAGSVSVNKMSNGSRHRRSINGFPGPIVSSGQKETGSSRSSSLHRNSASEKISQSGLTCERAHDVSIVEGNNHKLIVKIPNRGRSPAQSASGGSIDDPSIMNSRASSPVLSEKNDQSDHNSKEKSDANRVNVVSDVNTESWQSNDFKDVLTGSDEGDGSPTDIPEEQCKAGDDVEKLSETSKTAPLSSGNELKSGKLQVPSFSSMNALIESCVKCSEANASLSSADEVGMNLLATVAAGEMLKSDLISPDGSPQKSTPMAEDTCIESDNKSKSSRGNNLACEQSAADDAVADIDKQRVLAATSWSRDGLHHQSKQESGGLSEDGKTTSSVPEQTKTGENKECNSSNFDLQPTAQPYPLINERSGELRGDVSVAFSSVWEAEKVLDGEESKRLDEKVATVTSANVEGVQATKPKGSNALVTDDKVNEVSSLKVEKEEVESSSVFASSEVHYEDRTDENERSTGGEHAKQSEYLERHDKELMHHSSSRKDLPSESSVELKCGKVDEMDTRSHGSQVGKQKFVHDTKSSLTNENQVLAGLGSTVSDQKNGGIDTNVESKEVLAGGAFPKKEQPTFPALEVEQHMRLRGSKMTAVDTDETKESASTTAHASFPAAGASNMDAKLKFDLNEGFIVDEGKCGEHINLVGSGCSDAVHLVNSLPFPVSSVSSSLPASITVAAAAKGPFVPPEELLRSKGELGWKGSAATSAFRPAEPRKVLETPVCTTNVPLSDATAGKRGRPVLDIDLNVADDRALEDMASQNTFMEPASTSDRFGNCDLAHNVQVHSAPVRGSGGLDLDLNQVDEASDMALYSTGTTQRLEAPPLLVKSSSSGGFSNCEVRRDFDLNNGPLLDDGTAEPSSVNHHGRSSMQSLPSVAGLRMNNGEMGTFSSWLPTGNTYPPITIPSILSEKGEQPFPIVANGGPPRSLGPHTGGNPFTPDIYPGGPHTGGNPFTPDIYPGSVLSSSPAAPFPSTPLQYVFPFGTSFPPPSATFSGGSTRCMDSFSGGRVCFPAVNSQLLGPSATISSQYPRPYVVSLPDGSGNIGVDNNRKWARQGLDLNAGPVSLDVEGRGETSHLSSRQLSVASSQALVQEQAKMYQQLAGGLHKRKEPEGGWDTESFRYKQSSRQ